jgi:hypothetical protein
MNIKKKPTPRKSMKLENGKTVRAPKKGETLGEWVEVSRHPTEIVEFGWFRNEPMLVWFFDEVHRVRMLADGTAEAGWIYEKVAGKLDVRDEEISGGISNLLRVGAIAARGLASTFEMRKKKSPKKRR